MVWVFGLLVDMFIKKKQAGVKKPLSTKDKIQRKVGYYLASLSFISCFLNVFTALTVTNEFILSAITLLIIGIVLLITGKYTNRFTKILQLFIVAITATTMMLRNSMYFDTVTTLLLLFTMIHHYYLDKTDYNNMIIPTSILIGFMILITHKLYEYTLIAGISYGFYVWTAFKLFKVLIGNAYKNKYQKSFDAHKARITELEESYEHRLNKQKKKFMKIIQRFDEQLTASVNLNKQLLQKLAVNDTTRKM